MLPHTSGNYRTFVFADEVETTMHNANLRNTVKTTLAERIYP